MDGLPLPLPLREVVRDPVRLLSLAVALYVVAAYVIVPLLHALLESTPRIDVQIEPGPRPAPAP